MSSGSAPASKPYRASPEVIQILTEWFEKRGFDCHIQAIDEQASPVKYNFYARKGPDCSGGLVLSGRSDTVPIQAPRQSPVAGQDSADMTGFFASVICVLDQMNLSMLKRPLMITATTDEQGSLSGARCLDSEQLLDFECAIINSPTNLVPIHAHKGMLMERIYTEGEAGSSSSAHGRSNAIVAMHLIIAALMSWQKDLYREYVANKDYADFEAGWPIINLARIRGDGSAGQIAPECLLDIDYRFFADTTCAHARAQIYRLAMQAVDECGSDIKFEPLSEGIEAMHTPSEAPLIRALEQHAQISARGTSFVSEGSSFCRWIQDVAIFGPGRGDPNHQASEELNLESMQKYHHIMTEVVTELCCH